MSKSKLYDYLRKLSEEATTLTEFENDPDKAMSAAGLTESEKDALRSGDETKITALLGEDEKTLPRVVRIRNIRIRFGV